MPLSHNLRDCRAVRIEADRASLDLDRLGNCAGLHGHIDTRFLAYNQGDGVRHGLLESRSFNRDPVGSRRQEGQSEIAGRCCLRLVGDVGRDVRHINASVGKDRTRGVRHCAKDGSIGSALSMEQIGEGKNQPHQKKVSHVCKHRCYLLVTEDEFDLVQPFLANLERKG